jgi:hypothetical protein
MTEKCIGSTWLKQYYQISNFKLSHESYPGTRSKVELLQDGTVIATYQKMNYTL